LLLGEKSVESKLALLNLALG